MFANVPRVFGRFVAVSCASLFAVSACSVLPADLALVPVQAPPAQTTEAAPRPSSAPRPSKAPRVKRQGDSDAPGTAEVAVVRLKPRPAPGAFRMNLYRKGDFVHQATKDWCVAGSTLTMMNIIGDGTPRDAIAVQRRLYQRGRKLSPFKGKLGNIGVDLIGWAELLNTRGYGPYEVTGAATRRGAIRRAAKAIRLTGRPVGLVTWRGAHSWVMSGFTATADPAYAKDFQVKAAYIQDTWYPYVSTIWGASRPPNTLVPIGRLQEDFLPYARPRAKWPRRDGKFMLILPLLPEGTVAR